MNSPQSNMTSGTLPVSIGEPSFAEVIEAIEADADLRKAEKRFWSTSLRQMAKYLGMPISLVPARITAVGPKISVLHPERLNVNSKTFANHRATVRKALNWYRDSQLNSSRKAPMDVNYRQLLEQIDCRHHRDVLSPFFRYLTMEGVDPDAVRDVHIDGYKVFRQITSFKPLKPHQVRLLVRHLNRYSRELDNWPTFTLKEPPLAPRHRGPAWDNLSEGLRRDIEAALARRASIRRAANGRRLKPCKPSTLERLKRQLLAFIRKADATGIPVIEINSLSTLLDPKVVKPVLDAYWKDNGDNPRSYTIELADVLLGLARHDTNLEASALEALQDLAGCLAEYRQVGLTEKNRAVIREVLHGGLWPKVLALPHTLMAQARADSHTQPLKAAVTAQLAVAIHLLSVAPVRMHNLAAIRFGENLIRPGGPEAPYVIVFAEHDVKNRHALEFPLPPQTSALLDAYIHTHRPVLMRGRNHDYLFPSKLNQYKSSSTLGGQISALLYKRLGVRLTPHQFRHAAGAIILQNNPGNYELVRRVLGHTSIQTTIRSYIGLETTAATKQYGELVLAMTPDPAPPVPK